MGFSMWDVSIWEFSNRDSQNETSQNGISQIGISQNETVSFWDQGQVIRRRRRRRRRRYLAAAAAAAAAAAVTLSQGGTRGCFWRDRDGPGDVGFATDLAHPQTHFPEKARSPSFF